MTTWTDTQREAVKAFLVEAMPIPAYHQSPRIEETVPPNWRRGFEKLFKRLELDKPPS